MNTKMLSRMFLCAALVTAAITAGTGCTHFSMNTPDGFATLRNQRPRFDFRAASAYGVAIGVREIENRERANLDFWAEAVDHHLQRTGPYHAEGSTPVRTASGLAGRRLQYTHGDAQTGSTYWVTVFVVEKRVFVIEAGGASASFARARPGIEQAIQTFEGS